jgi:hypothetical protein
MNAETVAFNFRKRRCLVSFEDAEPSADVKTDRVGITMKPVFLSVKFPGCRIFVDHPGDTVLSCGDTNITLRIGWSVLTFDEKLTTLRSGESTTQLIPDMTVLSTDGFDFHFSQSGMELIQNTISVPIQGIPVCPIQCPSVGKFVVPALLPAPRAVARRPNAVIGERTAEGQFARRGVGSPRSHDYDAAGDRVES